MAPTRAFHFLVALAVSSSVSVTASPTRRQDVPSSLPFDWNSIKPSKNITWTPCYTNLTCMRFEVPLDYEDESAGTTDVAFIKWTSPNETAEDLVYGAGGPGASGIATWIPAHQVYTKWLGSSHNLITLDNRGVNNSGIDLSCFPDQPANAALYDQAISRVPELSTQRGLANRFARDKAYGEWCGNALKKGNAKYANTVAVANDIRNFFETTKKQAGGDPKEAKIAYFGISYGTVLGATLAWLFPDRIDRMILDGVTDAQQYYDGTWYDWPSDSDDAIRYFFRTCYEAGPSKCAFYANSTTAIEHRFNQILVDIDSNPLPVATHPMKIPMLLNSLDVRNYVYNSCKDPQSHFPTTAAILKQLENRNGTGFATIALGLDQVTANYTKNHTFGYSSTEPEVQIRCLDANGRFPMTSPDQLREYIQYQTSLSSYVGPLGSTAAVKCTYMDLAPPKSQQFSLPHAITKTKVPILFTSMRIDPVTPLRFAQKMSTFFEGTSVLVEESLGHGTFSWYSNCTAGHVQNYLSKGVLPPANTTCGVVGTAFTGRTE